MQKAMTLPPGLESMLGESAGKDSGKVSAATSAHKLLEDGEMWSMLAGLSCQQLAREVHEAVQVDLDGRVAEKLESVWKSGEQEAQKFFKESRSCQEELSKKVGDLLQSQEALELENAALQQMVMSVLGQLSQFNNAHVNAAFAQIGTPKVATHSVAESMSLNATPTPSPAAPTSEQSLFNGGLNSEESLLKWGAKFPEIPAFPVASGPTASPFSLSLADALGLDEASTSQHEVPRGLSQEDVVPPGLSLIMPECGSETFSPFLAASAVDPESDGFIFNITLRKAEGTTLGLATSQQGGALHITCILPGGAAEAWNRQCSNSGAADKVLYSGDTIVSVNDIGGDSAAMELECEHNSLLRLMVVRSDSAVAAPLYVASVPERTTTLRADASTFVPFSVPCNLVIDGNISLEQCLAADRLVC